MGFKHLSHKKGLTPEQRFWTQTKVSRNCWEWKGARDGDGYGQIGIDGKSTKAHRYSWLLHFGPIPKDRIVCHSCDNPPCVRPDHLFLGTHKENTHDCMVKGRRGNMKFPPKANRKFLRSRKIGGGE